MGGGACAAGFGGAAAAADCGTFAAGAAAAPPVAPMSMVHNFCPGFTVSPSLTKSSFMTPAPGDGTGTEVCGQTRLNVPRNNRDYSYLTCYTQKKRPGCAPCPFRSRREHRLPSPGRRPSFPTSRRPRSRFRQTQVLQLA